jgi:hypothetical protein
MSEAAWFIVLLALFCANLPFFNQRVFGVLALPSLPAKRRKPGWLRLLELIVLYFLVGGLGYVLESRAGNVFVQGWQFYAVSFSLFLVFTFPGFTFRYLVKHH